MSYIDDYIRDNAGTMTRDQVTARLRAGGYDEGEIRSALRRSRASFAAPSAARGAAWWSGTTPSTAARGDWSTVAAEAAASKTEPRALRVWVAFWTVAGIAFWSLGIVGALDRGDLEGLSGALGIAISWAGLGIWLLRRQRPGRSRGTSVLAVFAPVVLVVGSLVVGGFVGVVIQLILELLGITSL